MGKLMGEFKEFIMRGNVMDLAVGVIIGGAFGSIVTSLCDVMHRYSKFYYAFEG